MKGPRLGVLSCGFSIDCSGAKRGAPEPPAQRLMNAADFHRWRRLPLTSPVTHGGTPSRAGQHPPPHSWRTRQKTGDFALLANGQDNPSAKGSQERFWRSGTSRPRHQIPQ